MSDSKIKDFIRSKEGRAFIFDFEKCFDCRIGFLEPGDDLFFEVKNPKKRRFCKNREYRTYIIPDDFDVDVFKDLILRSFQEDKNLIYETFKKNVVRYIPGVEY